MFERFTDDARQTVVRAQEPVEQIQTVGPEALVEGQPLVRAGEPPGGEAAQMGAAAHLAPDEPGVFQRLDVLRGGRERDRKGFRKLTDRSLATGEFAKHPSARGVAEGVKDGIELRCV